VSERFCNVPDHVAHARAGWAVRPIRWTVTDHIPGVPDELVKSITAEGLARWAAAADLSFEYTGRAADANILITFRDIDGPLGVLAEAELPHGQKQCRVWFDREAWIVHGTPAQRQVKFALVDWHELGHALGLGHITGEVALMNPSYNPTLGGLQPADIRAIKALYGKPRLPPAPAPEPAPTPGGSMQNWLVQLAINALKQFLEQKLKDGSLQRWLEELLKGLTTGKITTAAELGAHVQQVFFHS